MFQCLYSLQLSPIPISPVRIVENENKWCKALHACQKFVRKDTCSYAEQEMSLETPARVAWGDQTVAPS